MVDKVMFVQSSHLWDAIASTQAQLIRSLDCSRFEVHVACTPRPSPQGGASVLEHLSSIPDIHLRVVDFGPSFHGPWKSTPMDGAVSLAKLPLEMATLALYMKRKGIDIVHIGPKPRDVYGLLLARALRIKCLFHIHFLYGEWMLRSVKWSIRAADCVIGVSDFTAKSVITLGNIPAQRVDYVYNSIDTVAWRPDIDGSAVRREFGIAPGDPLLGIVARLIEWKGHQELFEALALVLRDHPRTKLLVVGDESPHAQGRSGYKEELKAKARALGVDHALVFTGFRHDMPAIMASLDVLVFPAWEEGFGLVLLEAMAMKKVVVTWASGGPREVVVDQETGFVVEPKNPPAMAEAIGKLLRDPALRERLAAAGLKRAQEVFSSEAAAEKLAQIYRRCLGR